MGQNPRLPRGLQSSKRKNEHDLDPPGKRQRFARRCTIYPRNNDRKSFFTCVKCTNFVCIQHSFTLCDNCQNEISNN